MTERRDFLKHMVAGAAGVFSQGLLWDATKVLGGKKAEAFDTSKVPELLQQARDDSLVKDWYRKYFDEMDLKEYVQDISDQMATHCNTTIGQPIQNPFTDLNEAQRIWNECSHRLNVLQAGMDAMSLELGNFMLSYECSHADDPAFRGMGLKTVPVASIANSMPFYQLTNVVVESVPFWFNARELPRSMSLILDAKSGLEPNYVNSVLFDQANQETFDPIEGGFYQLWAVLSLGTPNQCGLHRITLEPMTHEDLDDYFLRHPLQETEPCNDESLLESQYGEPWPQQS